MNLKQAITLLKRKLKLEKRVDVTAIMRDIELLLLVEGVIKHGSPEYWDGPVNPPTTVLMRAESAPSALIIEGNINTERRHLLFQLKDDLGRNAGVIKSMHLGRTAIFHKGYNQLVFEYRGSPLLILDSDVGRLNYGLWVEEIHERAERARLTLQVQELNAKRELFGDLA